MENYTVNATEQQQLAARNNICALGGMIAFLKLSKAISKKYADEMMECLSKVDSASHEIWEQILIEMSMANRQ